MFNCKRHSISDMSDLGEGRIYRALVKSNGSPHDHTIANFVL